MVSSTKNIKQYQSSILAIETLRCCEVRVCTGVHDTTSQRTVMPLMGDEQNDGLLEDR
jgi:hypothetical protein